MVYLHACENTHYVRYDVTLSRNVGHIILILSVKWDMERPIQLFGNETLCYIHLDIRWCLEYMFLEIGRAPFLSLVDGIE